MTTLFEEIQAKCSVDEFQGRNMHIIASVVSVDRVKTGSRMISERGIMESYPGGPTAADTVLSKLEAFATSGAPGSGPVKRAMKFVAQSDGLDIGSVAAQAMLTSLGAAGVITVTEANNLKALAESPDPVTWEQCQAAFLANGA